MKAVLGQSKIAFLSRIDGMEKISTSDSYSRGLTKFDRMAKTRSLDPNVTESDYLQNCRSYVRGWTDDQVNYISMVVEEAHQRFSDLKISVKLPETIYFVASAGWEEGGARGYTREDAIYLNHTQISKDLVLHELFHVLTRYNVQKRDEIYATLRFVKCNDLDYQEDLRITNPDAPSLCHFVTFKYQNQENFGAIIIRSAREYSGGGFFSYVEKKILLLEEHNSSFYPMRRDGKYVFIDFADASRLYSKIGRNTAYSIHQEEVSAEHFVALMTAKTDLPDQQLVSDMLTILREPCR